MAVRHLILDRDGVLNVEAHGCGYVTKPDQWQWIPGALEALAQLHQAGIRMSIATNQSAVGRGLMTRADLDSVHRHMLADVVQAGGSIAAVYVCPHRPEQGCGCRKPAPGLIRSAVAESGIGVEETLVVGDDIRDLAAARGAGVEAVLVLTGKGQHAAALRRPATPIYDDIGALARFLVAVGGPERGQCNDDTRRF